MMTDQIHIQNLWRPALEILILAVVIYYVFRFLRGTRGWPVVIGFVVVLLALALVTTLLNLQVLRWLLGSVLGVLRRCGAGHFSTGTAPDAGRTGQPAAVRHRAASSAKTSRSSSRPSSGSPT